jgi:hypothetical protein
MVVKSSLAKTDDLAGMPHWTDFGLVFGKEQVIPAWQ